MSLHHQRAKWPDGQIWWLPLKERHKPSQRIILDYTKVKRTPQMGPDSALCTSNFQAQSLIFYIFFYFIYLFIIYLLTINLFIFLFIKKIIKNIFMSN